MAYGSQAFLSSVACVVVDPSHVCRLIQTLARINMLGVWDNHACLRGLPNYVLRKGKTSTPFLCEYFPTLKTFYCTSLVYSIPLKMYRLPTKPHPLTLFSATMPACHDCPPPNGYCSLVFGYLLYRVSAVCLYCPLYQEPCQILHSLSLSIGTCKAGRRGGLKTLHTLPGAGRGGRPLALVPLLQGRIATPWGTRPR